MHVLLFTVSLSVTLDYKALEILQSEGWKGAAMGRNAYGL